MAINDKNWRFIVECVDCEAEFLVPENAVDYSVNRINPTDRLAIVHVTQQCPACGNLKVAGAKQ